METLIHFHWRRFGLALLVLCGCLSHGAAARQGVPSGGVGSDAALDLLLTREAQRLLDLDRMEQSLPTNVTVTARADIAGKHLIIDFGPGFLPAEDDGSTEEVVQDIRGSVRYYMERAVLEEVQVEILYEGLPLHHHFPLPRQGAARARLAVPGAVLVSASHGWIRVFPSGAWELQRPLAHGIREDLITPGFAGDLQRLLQDRSSAVVYRARRGDQEAHPESLHPWAQMSSRYHLKSLLPERTDIWSHFANSTARNREVKDDIRARPYYANYLGVEGMISVHTNGSRNQELRGAEVYYHPTKPGDRELASMALCYMKELITSHAGYEDFPVRTAASAADHGENGFAEMPSMLVEVAYHSNALDAAALQDPVFRAASMKGVEKGYRLFHEGKDCKPLKGEAIENVSMSQGSVREIDVPFEGYPQYPLRIVTRNVGCPPGWVCRDNEVTVDAPQPIPLKIALACNNVGSAPLFWETSLVDDDWVKSVPVRHRQQCIRSS